MNLDKDVESWARVSPNAVLSGSDAQRVNVLNMALHDIAVLHVELQKYREWAKRATRALTKVRPLGGSELYMRLGDDCVADPEWCGNAIEDLRESLHKARMGNVRLQKASDPAVTT